MTRQLESWAQSTAPRKRPRVTWPADMLAFARSGFGLRTRRPVGAPPKPLPARDRLAPTDVRRAPGLRYLLSWRLDYHVAGLDALKGLQGPVVFAVNEEGTLDWQVLRAVLPPRLRTATRRLSRALSTGRSVVVFSEDPTVAGGVGEFSTVAAELAHQHTVPIVPVALRGTFSLNEVLRLSLIRRPRVSVRFGAPLYVRGRTVAEATAEVQAAVGELCESGELSWWSIQRRSELPQATVGPSPRWRRLWQQTAARSSEDSTRIWR